MGALHNLTLQNSTNGWIADSGASTHLAADPGVLSSVSLILNYPLIYVRNGQSMHVTHVGLASLSNPTWPLYLQKVLVTP